VRPSVDREAELWEAPGLRKFQPNRPVPVAVREDKRQRFLPLAAKVQDGQEPPAETES
jgi:hypothetical protein